MSPRAAVRLRQLGFRRVYDYAGGKNDWLAAGLSIEGQGLGRMAVDALVREPPTCTLDESLESALARLVDGWPFCVVVDADGVVLGLLRPTDAATVEAAMEPGPTTVRASEPLEPLLEALQNAPEPLVAVTDPDGRLLGVVDARRT